MFFSQEGYRNFAQGLIEAYKRQVKPDTALLLSALTSEQAQQVVEAFDTEATVAEPMQIARDCVRRIQLADIEETMQGLREQAVSEQFIRGGKAAVDPPNSGNGQCATQIARTIAKQREKEGDILWKSKDPA